MLSAACYECPCELHANFPWYASQHSHVKYLVQVFDHVLTNSIAFLPFVALAYLTLARKSVLAAPAAAKCRALTARPSHLDIPALLRRAYLLLQSTAPALLRPLEAQFSPLPAAGTYPQFTRFPGRALEAQAAARRRVRDEAGAVRDRERTLAALQVRSLHQ